MKKYLYIVDGQRFSVAEANVSKFLAKYPNAKNLADEEVKKKEYLPSTDGVNPGSPSESQSSSTNPQPPFLSPNPAQPKSGNDLYDFMTKPAAYVAEKTVEGKLSNIVEGKANVPVSEIDIKDLKFNRPDIYQQIKAGVRDNTATKDIYDNSDVASVTAKLNNLAIDGRDKAFAANFKKATGLEYNTLNSASISATQRRDLGIPPLPGDIDLLDKEITAADIDKRFSTPALKNPFLPADVYAPGKPAAPLSPILVEQTPEDIKNQIVNDPEKRRQYSVRRIEEEQQKAADKQQEINDKQYQRSVGSIRQRYETEKNVRDKEKIAVIKLEEINTNKSELSSLNKIIQQQKQVAENASDILEPERIAKQKKFDLKTVEGKSALRDYLTTEEGRADIGFGKKLNSDPKFAATVETLLADKASESEGVGMEDIFAIARNLIDPNSTNIPTTQYETFKSLSDSGNDTIQAEIRLAGHESAKNYARLNGDEGLLAHLQGQDDFVVQENGKALKNEIWAKVSAQKFKDDGNKVGGGDADDDGLLTYGTEKLKTYGRNLTETERKIYERDLIPDEIDRTITSNFQTSGFFQNFAEAIGGMVVSVGNVARNDQSRIKETFNDNTGRFEEIGQYSPFMQELEQLQSKQVSQALTPQEEQRKLMLESNTNLLNGWQKLKAGSGNVTGQVVGQALFASLLGGVGGVLAKGLGIAGEAAAIGAEGASVLAKGEFVTAEAASVAMRAEAAAGRLTFATAETGLKAETAGAKILARNAEGQPIKWSFNADIAPVETLGGKVVNYAKENANLFMSSYANAYDGYAKEALESMPGSGNGVRRSLYAGMMATFEGLSEKIFDDRKVFTAFKSEISPVVISIASELSNKTITQAAAIKKLQQVILGGNPKAFAKKFLANSNQEGMEEVSVGLAGDMAKAMILGQNYDVVASIGSAMKTYYSMVVDGALVAGIAARGDVRANTINKTTMYHVATNAQEYRSEVQRLKFEGDITEEQRVEKNIIINTAEAAYANMQKDGIVSKNGKNDGKNAAYLLHTVNQAVLTEQAANTTEDIRKADLLKQAEKSKKIREGIYTGAVNVDEFLNPVTTDPKVATDLDIDLVPVVAPVPATAPEVKAEPIVLTAEQKKQTLLATDSKEKALLIAAKKDGTYDEVLLQSALAKGIVTQPAPVPAAAVPAAAAAAESTVPKEGDKVMYQGVEHTVGSVYDTPTGTQSYSLVDAEGNQLLGANNKPKFVSATSISPIINKEVKADVVGSQSLPNKALEEIHNNSVLHGTDGGYQVKKSDKSYETAKDIRQKVAELTNGEIGKVVEFKTTDSNGDGLYHVAISVHDTKRGAGQGFVAYSVKVEKGSKLSDNEIYSDLRKNLDGVFEQGLVNKEGIMSDKISLKDINKQPIKTTSNESTNTQSSQATNTKGNNAQDDKNTQAGNNEENKVSTEFIAKETQHEALTRLTKGIENLPADQQKAEIEKRAAEHETSYREFTKGENKISGENSKIQRVSEFGTQTAKAMTKFLTPKGKQEFAANKGAFENGSRIDEDGKTISENDFVTLKEKVKTLKQSLKNQAFGFEDSQEVIDKKKAAANNILSELDKINNAPRAYLKAAETTSTTGNTVSQNEQQQDIEKRRQNELEKANARIEKIAKSGDSNIRTKVETYRTLDINGNPVEVEISTNKDGSRTFTARQINEDGSIDPYAYVTERINNKAQLSLTNEKLVEGYIGNEGNTLKKVSESNNPNQDYIDKINAKYDAEQAGTTGTNNAGAAKNPPTKEEINLELKFINEKDFPKETVIAKNKAGKQVGTKEVANERLVLMQKEIKDKLETLKKLLKCLEQ